MPATSTRRLVSLSDAASSTAHVTASAIKWSRKTWRVIEPHVVTASTVLRRPAPATRTHTLASFLQDIQPPPTARVQLPSNYLPSTRANEASVGERAGR